MSEAAPRDGALYSLIAVMVLLWSANFVIGKFALREFPPILLCGLRVALAGLFILPAYVHRMRTTAESWGRKDLPVLIYLGVFGVAANQTCFLIGLSRTSVAHSAIVIATTPILVLLIAAALKQERITPRKVAGMAIAIVGVGILNAGPASSGAGAATVLGDLFVFLAGLTFAMFTVIAKQVSLRHSGVTVNTFGYVGGALTLAPVTLWQARGFSFTHVSAGGWISLFYMALFPSVICYLIYFYALTRISASRVSAFTYLQPIIATSLAILILGERVTAPLIAGGAVIFAGVYLTERG